MSILPLMDSASLLPCEFKNPACPFPIHTPMGGAGGAPSAHTPMSGVRMQSAVAMTRMLAMMLLTLWMKDGGAELRTGGRADLRTPATGSRRRAGRSGRHRSRWLSAFREQVANFLEKDFRPGRRRGGRRSGRRGLLELVDAFDGDEQDECNDDEIKHGLDESAVLDQYLLARGVLAQSHRQIREIETAYDLAERGHEDIADQRGNDLSESGADDYADRQVDHVALHGKFFEFCT